MSDTTRILLIRHGETDWNAAQRLQGHTDVSLNDRGRRQVARLADALRGEGIGAIYSSDLQRAMDTALAFAPVGGGHVVPHAGLRERGFGAFEGLTYAAIEEQYPREAMRWRAREPHFAAPDGGESLQSFSDRAITTALRLATAHRGQTIALVTHGGVLDCLYRAAQGIALQPFGTWPIGNAAINRLTLQDGSLRLVGWHDVAHLRGL